MRSLKDKCLTVERHVLFVILLLSFFLGSILCFRNYSFIFILYFLAILIPLLNLKCHFQYPLYWWFGGHEFFLPAYIMSTWLSLGLYFSLCSKVLFPVILTHIFLFSGSDSPTDFLNSLTIWTFFSYHVSFFKEVLYLHIFWLLSFPLVEPKIHMGNNVVSFIHNDTHVPIIASGS